MLRITSTRESTASMIAIMTQYMDPDVATVLSKSYENKPLSVEDTAVMEGYVWSVLLTLQDDFIDNREGVYSDERWRSRVRFLDAIFISSGARTWWGTFKVTFTREFQSLVESRITNLPETEINASELMMEGKPIPINE